MKIIALKISFTAIFTLLGAMFVTLPALAADSLQVFENHTQQGLSFQTQGEFSQAVLTVAGNDGIVFKEDLGNSQNLSYQLLDQSGNPLPDGDYQYQLVLVGLSVEEESAESPIVKNSGQFSIIDVELVFSGDEKSQN